MKALLSLGALFALAACATGGAAPSGERSDYRCARGAAFSVRYDNEGNAQVFAGGQTYRLPGVAAASGNRYFDGQVEFWDHHGEAMLGGAQGGPYENCRQAG